MTLIKVCGITNEADALAAVEAGADALGFNFYAPSPRFIPPEQARMIIDRLPGNVMSVGVFVNEPSPQSVRNIALRAGVKAVQLHGDESPVYCAELSDFFVIKTFAVGDEFDQRQILAYQVDAIMLDAKDDKLRGGTGRAANWAIAREVAQNSSHMFLAGGLSAENVEEAIIKVKPYAVDACSGLEEAPGIKNSVKMRSFVKTAKRC
jgi:phosphoribosylanthranilate isomerase